MKTVLMGLSRSRLGARRGVRAGVLALVVTAIAVFATPMPSMAAGDDYYTVCDAAFVSCQTGVKVSYPAGVCDTVSSYYHSTIVCVDYYGDYVYVKDNNADGHSAMGYIRGGNGDVLDRHCRNPYGAGSWARCNFDWTESGEKSVYGGYRVSTTYWSYGYLWSFSGN